ncbi:MAG TPA: hypothetical protein VMY35_08055 [Phycisphaerae bacterium]|nr:hypothetical protein [Phycisphaerae bacterium]
MTDNPGAQAKLFPRPSDPVGCDIITPGRQDFGGATYEPDRDYAALAAQYQRVFRLMQDGQWRTLREIGELAGYEPQSVSARLRDFRKEKFGGHQVLRQLRSRRLWEYRLVVHQEP